MSNNNNISPEGVLGVLADLDEQIAAKREQAIRDVTQHFLNHYFDHQLPIEVQKQLGKLIAEKFDEFAADIYVNQQSQNFDF